MQSNFSYKASANIDQYDLLAVDAANSNAITIAAKPANSGDDILGRADQKIPVGEPVIFSTLTVGECMTVIAGDTIAAGDHLSASNGKVIPGASALMAIEAATAGQRVRCVMTASDRAPAIADKARALDVSTYVGGPTKHMYILNTGVPVASSATVGDASTPIYMQGGVFTACTSAGGGASFDIDSNGFVEVGSFGLFVALSSGSTNWSANVGNEITLSSIHTLDIPCINGTSGFSHEHDGSLQYPSSAKVKLFTKLLVRTNGQCLIFGRRTA